MNYQVIVVPQARLEFQHLYDYIVQRSKQGADSWANAFYATLQVLETSPDSHALAAESENHRENIRDLKFRTRRGKTYRVFVCHSR